MLCQMAINSVYEFAYKGNFSKVKDIISEDKNVLNKKDESGRLLIHWAAVGGHENIVLFLLGNGVPVDPLDDSLMTPLILAASAGRENIVRILLSRGANINAVSSEGHSALQYACSKNWKEIVQMLLANHADINIVDKRGATPLHRAASKGNTEITLLLLDQSQEINVNATDSYGNTPLHLACEENREAEAKALVLNGANLDVKNKEKKTPLDIASPSLARQLQSILLK